MHSVTLLESRPRHLPTMGLACAAWVLALLCGCERNADPRALGAAPAEPRTNAATPTNTGAPAMSFAAAIGPLVLDPAAAELSYWRDKPLLKELVQYSLKPAASKADREAVRRMKAGDFQPDRRFEWEPAGVPPPWEGNPMVHQTSELYTHAMRWMVPLIDVWYVDGDEECLALVVASLRDWHSRYAQPGSGPPFAWGDHAVSIRLRVLCWLWELYRTRATAPAEDFAVLLLRLIHTDAEFLASGKTYAPRSNHGLEQNVALLGAAAIAPEFRAAPAWRASAYARLQAYVAENFSPEGFHLEQSPGYHAFVLSRLGALLQFLRVNQQLPLPEVDAVTRRVAAVWPYLVQPDGSLPLIGDTPRQIMSRDFARERRRWWPEDAPAVADSTWANPRGDGAALALSFLPGYAVFTAYPIETPVPEDDTYVLFKCNSTRLTSHGHLDGLSFTLYGLGREWLVDSGYYCYDDELPERQFVCGPRAHNVLLVDDQEFTACPAELVDAGRNARGDFVSVRHDLPQAWHTRTVMFVPPRTLEITDGVETRDGAPHTYTQLFHVAPELRAEIVSDRVVQLVAESSAGCQIEQSGDAGVWSKVRGQRAPCLQGWYSRGYLELEENDVVSFSTPAPCSATTFRTTITLVPGP